MIKDKVNMILSSIKTKKPCDSKSETAHFSSLIEPLMEKNEIGLYKTTGCSIKCNRFVYKIIPKHNIEITRPGKYWKQNVPKF